MSLSGENEEPHSAPDPRTERSAVQVGRAGSPVPSCSSETSEKPTSYPADVNAALRDASRVRPQRAGTPVASCTSMKTDNSMDYPINLKGEEARDSRPRQPADPDKTDRSTYFVLALESLQSALGKLTKDELTEFSRQVSQHYPECFEALQDTGSAIIPEKMMEAWGEERALKITLHILRNINQMDLAHSLEREEQRNQSIKIGQQKLKEHLKRRHECVSEGIARQGSSVLLNDIHTELCITVGGSDLVSEEHGMSAVKGTSVKCNDIFKRLAGRPKAMRTVLTKGIAGIGKTISVRKFILDWAEGKANGHINFVFPLSFRDLNLQKGKKCSLQQLLQLYFPELKGLESVDLDELNVLLILDGLDESRLSLDFHNNDNLFDVRRSASLDVLLTNLIKGNLLPSALLWITSQPAAAARVPAECVHRVTEIHGFGKPQTKEYFLKKVGDVDLAYKVMSHIKKSKGLCTMCHIPVFCWILATFLEPTMSGESESREIPTTLTQIYISFVLIQTNMKKEKHSESREPDLKVLSQDDKELIQKLAKFAFHQLEKENFVFYEGDLKECGIDATQASLHSGLCTEIFPEEDVLVQCKAYSFVHLSVQEFLAALYVFNSYADTYKNLLDPEPRTGAPHREKCARITLFDLHKSAVDKALGSKNPNLNLFLRFLLGLSLESRKGLLQGALARTESGPLDLQETARYIMEKMKENVSPQMTNELRYCLKEMEHVCPEERGNLTMTLADRKNTRRDEEELEDGGSVLQ
ncbi:protein NLRC3-like isoform X1 [Scleropages formosus]|nr:protein NLRC3-like isoform X1 [Scleropages formosus]